MVNLPNNFVNHLHNVHTSLNCETNISINTKWINYLASFLKMEIKIPNNEITHRRISKGIVGIAKLPTMLSFALFMSIYVARFMVKSGQIYG